MSEAHGNSVARNTVARWLWAMRWHAVCGQSVAVLLGKYAFHLELPAPRLFALIGLAALSNVLVWRYVLGLLLVDVALLTAMLWLSGGADNPFVVIYIVHVALASFVLETRQAALVALAAGCGYALLFAQRSGVVIPYALFLRGLAVAVAISSALVFVFIARLAGRLRERREELHRAEQLAALGAFAAEAAHELGSPLGTIAVAANDMPGEDAELIREEIERCQRILERMHHRAGQMHGEVEETLLASESVRAALSELRAVEEQRVRVEIAQDATLTCPQIGLRAALLNVVSNALQASAEEVVVRVFADASRCRITVEDRGPGMRAEHIARIGEPFTNSGAKKGMGLGLFLTSAFITRVGGTLRIDSRPGAGTSVAMEIPR